MKPKAFVVVIKVRDEHGRFVAHAPKEYPCEIAFIPIDVKTLMPMQILSFDWNNKLVSNYEV